MAHREIDRLDFKFVYCPETQAYSVDVLCLVRARIVGSRASWPYISHVGPLARSVSDLALYMEGIVKRYHATWDLSQATVSHRENMDFTMDYLSRGVKGA